MFNGNLSYRDVLSMPTDMRLNYMHYVSDQFEKRTKADQKMLDDLKNQNPKRETPHPPIEAKGIDLNV